MAELLKKVDTILRYCRNCKKETEQKIYYRDPDLMDTADADPYWFCTNCKEGIEFVSPERQAEHKQTGK